MKHFKSTLAVSAAACALIAPATPASAQFAYAYIGELALLGTNFCPRGSAQANGALINIASNTALFSLLGTTYGGNGTTTFQLPDLRGRAPVSQGQKPGLNFYSIGQSGGTEYVTLTQNELGPHTHVVDAEVFLRTSSKAANTGQPSGNALASYPAGTPAYAAGPGDEVGMPVNASLTIGNAGGSQAHENRDPFLTMQWCIATQGVFPPRN